MPDEHGAIRTAAREAPRPGTDDDQAEQRLDQAEQQPPKAEQPSNTAPAEQAPAQTGGELQPSGRYLLYLVPFLAVWVVAIAGLVLYFAS